MAAEKARPGDELIARPDEPVYTTIVEENGQELVRYFTERPSRHEATMQPQKRAAVLALAGVWADLDFEATIDELERHRRSNRPTPPITDI